MENNHTEENTTFSINFIDKILLTIVSTFLVSGFLFWFVANILRTNIFLVWAMVIPVGIVMSFLILKDYSFTPIRFGWKVISPYLLFFGLLLVSALFLLEPIMTYPYSSIGLPYKDLHDGFAVFISDNGYPPPNVPNSQIDYLPYRGNEKYLAYPNALHSSAAFLNKIGVFPFHSTWIVVVGGLLITSIALFLLIKFISKDIYYSAIISGLFAMSSFRISYAAFTSITMLFAYSLFIPTLLLCLFAIYNKRSLIIYILPSFGLALLAASYYGGIFIFWAMLVFLGALAFFLGEKGLAKRLGELLFISLPFILFAFSTQKLSYWQNTFATIDFYDPYEPSQLLSPMDKPWYMFFYGISLLIAIYGFWKMKLKPRENLLKIYLLLINIGFLLLIPFDFLFHHLNNIYSSTQFELANRGGLFGALNHQKVSRLALLQPFFFIFFLADFGKLIKNRVGQISLVILIILGAFFIRINLPFYSGTTSEAKSLLYNPSNEGKMYTLISHLNPFVAEGLWSREIIEALDFLRFQSNIKGGILLWNEGDPSLSERSLAGWGSIYARKRILYRFELPDPKEKISEELINNYVRQKVSYLLILYPTSDNSEALRKNSHARLIWRSSSVFLYHLSL